MNKSPEHKLHDLLKAKNKTLILAESCTGGALAARITSLSGASQFLLGSIVAYDNALKHQLLHVSQETLENYGAVSAETAQEMALGALAIIPCDYAIAVTGIAGPTGGTLEKPVGTIWGALAKQGENPFVWKITAEGDRQKIIQTSIDQLLETFINKIQNDAW